MRVCVCVCVQCGTCSRAICNHPLASSMGHACPITFPHPPQHPNLPATILPSGRLLAPPADHHNPNPTARTKLPTITATPTATNQCLKDIKSAPAKATPAPGGPASPATHPPTTTPPKRQPATSPIANPSAPAPTHFPKFPATPVKAPPKRPATSATPSPTRAPTISPTITPTARSKSATITPTTLTQPTATPAALVNVATTNLSLSPTTPPQPPTFTTTPAIHAPPSATTPATSTQPLAPTTPAALARALDQRTPATSSPFFTPQPAPTSTAPTPTLKSSTSSSPSPSQPTPTPPRYPASPPATQVFQPSPSSNVTSPTTKLPAPNQFTRCCQAFDQESEEECYAAAEGACLGCHQDLCPRHSTPPAHACRAAHNTFRPPASSPKAAPTTPLPNTPSPATSTPPSTPRPQAPPQHPNPTKPVAPHSKTPLHPSTPHPTAPSVPYSEHTQHKHRTGPSKSTPPAKPPTDPLSAPCDTEGCSCFTARPHLPKGSFPCRLGCCTSFAPFGSKGELASHLRLKHALVSFGYGCLARMGLWKCSLCSVVLCNRSPGSHNCNASARRAERDTLRDRSAHMAAQPPLPGVDACLSELLNFYKAGLADQPPTDPTLPPEPPSHPPRHPAPPVPPTATTARPGAPRNTGTPLPIATWSLVVSAIESLPWEALMGSSSTSYRVPPSHEFRSHWAQVVRTAFEGVTAAPSDASWKVVFSLTQLIFGRAQDGKYPNKALCRRRLALLREGRVTEMDSFVSLSKHAPDGVPRRPSTLTPDDARAQRAAALVNIGEISRGWRTLHSDFTLAPDSEAHFQDLAQLHRAHTLPEAPSAPPATPTGMDSSQARQSPTPPLFAPASPPVSPSSAPIPQSPGAAPGASQPDLLQPPAPPPPSATHYFRLGCRRPEEVAIRFSPGSIGLAGRAPHGCFLSARPVVGPQPRRPPV